MSDDQFTKLFKYMQDEFAKVRQDVQDVKIDVERVYNLVDGDLKHRETEEQERLAANRQLDRHEDWIVRASKHLDVSYEQ